MPATRRLFSPGLERVSPTAMGVIMVSTLISPMAIAAKETARFIPIPSTEREPGSNPNTCAYSGTDGYSTVRVSADGSTVSALTLEGGFVDGYIDRFIVRWTEETGSVRVTPSLGLYPSVGVSADGTVIWGDKWRWTQSGGFEYLTGSLSSYSFVFGCADDGTTVAGYTSPDFYPFCGDLFRSTDLVGEPWEILPRSPLNPDGYFYFSTISGDGRTVAGAACGPDGTFSAIVVYEDGEVVNITPTQQQSNFVNDLSFDGSIAVGNALSPQLVSAFRWSEAAGFEDLGAQFPGASFARTCNADGTIVAGQYSVQGFPSAWISTPETGPVDFREWLITRFGLEAEVGDWLFTVITDVSADGRTIVGSALGPSGCEQAFVVRIDSPRGNSADFDGNGVIDATDLATLLADWGRSDADTDLNGDGVVGAEDLTLLLAAWGPVN